MESIAPPDGDGTFGPMLEGLRSLIPRSLIDGGGWERLIGRVGYLPGDAVANCFGFEFRLDEVSREADFVIPVIRGLALERYFIQVGKTVPPGSPEDALAQHLERAAATESGPSEDGQGLLLEYDIATAGPDRRPPPGIFISHIGAAPGCLADKIADAAGMERDPAERAVVERAAAALPPKAFIAQVGMLPGRQPRAIRVVAARVRAGDLGSCLERLGAPSDTARTLVATLPRIRDLFHAVWLSFDVVAGAVAPRVGIELGAPAGRTGGDPAIGPGSWMGTNLSNWRGLIDRLETLGWCRPEKARGLRDWPGRSTIFERRGVYFMYRGINHAKVVIEGDSVYAKAYVGATYGPAGGEPGNAATR